jgi:HSP20 family protein
MATCYSVYPRANFGGVQREIDRLFGQATEAIRPATSSTRVGEDEGNHYVELDAPGLQPDSLDVTVKDHDLTVHAKYDAAPDDTTPITWRAGAPATGEFTRNFRLPDKTDANGIQATYRHGVLRLTVPKSEVEKPKQISVQVN